LKKLLIFVTLIVIILAIPTIYNYFTKRLYPIDYIEIVNIKSEKYDIDPYLILAIIKNESKFDKNAKSTAGAKGLMQIVDSTADEVATELKLSEFESNHIFDPETNIEIGTKYFAKILSEFDNNNLLAVAAYNAGPSKVKSWLDDEIISENDVTTIPYKETNSYVRRVIRDYEIYKDLYK
jgi:soluble lytic murein transglycosylase